MGFDHRKYKSLQWKYEFKTSPKSMSSKGGGAILAKVDESWEWGGLRIAKNWLMSIVKAP